ncbi:MAG: hypothetical protein QMC23_05380 [Rubritalea sp.]|tara:strand:- start:31 stop:537 length:507 start_codon:yes stop_codon:yes gene_type:complete
MKPPSGKVIMFCGTNRGDAKDCVNWAVDEMCNGEDSPSLRILAGLTPPLSSFEVRDYASKALRELGLSVIQGSDAITAYAHDLIKEIIDTPNSMSLNLRILCDMCIDEDHLDDINDFYTLRWAFDDLQDAEVQWYWEGATQSNIEEIVLNQCRIWLNEYEIKRENKIE